MISLNNSNFNFFGFEPLLRSFCCKGKKNSEESGMSQKRCFNAFRLTENKSTQV